MRYSFNTKGLNFECQQLRIWLQVADMTSNTAAPVCALAHADGFLGAEIMLALLCLCIKWCRLILCLSQVSAWFFSAARHQQTWWVMSSTKNFVMKMVQKFARRSSQAIDKYCFLLRMFLLSTKCFLKKILVNILIKWNMVHVREMFLRFPPIKNWRYSNLMLVNAATNKLITVAIIIIKNK